MQRATAISFFNISPSVRIVSYVRVPHPILFLGDIHRYLPKVRARQLHALRLRSVLRRPVESPRMRPACRVGHRLFALCSPLQRPRSRSVGPCGRRVCHGVGLARPHWTDQIAIWRVPCGFLPVDLTCAGTRLSLRGWRLLPVSSTRCWPSG